MSDREQKGPEGAMGNSPEAAGEGPGLQDRLRQLGLARKMMLRKAAAAQGALPHADKQSAVGDKMSSMSSMSAEQMGSASVEQQMSSGSAEQQMSSASAEQLNPEKLQTLFDTPDEVVGSMEGGELTTLFGVPDDLWQEMEKELGSGSFQSESSSSDGGMMMSSASFEMSSSSSGG